MKFKLKDAKSLHDQFIKSDEVSKNNLKLNLYFTGDSVHLDDLLMANVPNKMSIRLIDHHWLKCCESGQILFTLVNDNVNLIKEKKVLLYVS